MLKFLSVNDLQKDLPDSLKSEINRGYFSPDTTFGNHKISVTSILKTNNAIYTFADGKLKIFNPKTRKFETKYFADIPYDFYNNISKYKNFLLIAGNNGLIKFDLNKTDYIKTKPLFNLRKITSGKNSILLDTLPGNYSLNFDFNKNNITINYASLYKKNGNIPEFLYKIESLDTIWTKTSKTGNLNLKHLHEGNYTIQLKAVTKAGTYSKIKTLQFTIFPPWYRSNWAYLAYITILTLSIWLIVRWNTARLKARNAELEKIVEERTKEIKQQKNHIEEIHSELKDSIIYAEKIQKAVLPTIETIHKNISEIFILFKPKDIVSGDFYWSAKVEKKLIITVAGCTGHGVPGGFMSMLGVSFLNEIVLNDKTTNPAEILNQLRKKTIHALKQTGESGSQKDGMDMAIISINHETNVVQFSGANNPLYLIKNEELKIKNDKIVLFDNSKSETKNSKLLYEIKPDKNAYCNIRKNG